MEEEGQGSRVRDTNRERRKNSKKNRKRSKKKTKSTPLISPPPTHHLLWSLGLLALRLGLSGRLQCKSNTTSDHVDARTNTRTPTNAHTHTHANECTNADTTAPTHTRAHTHICAHTHTHAHTCTHTHTHSHLHTEPTPLLGVLHKAHESDVGTLMNVQAEERQSKTHIKKERRKHKRIQR